MKTNYKLMLGVVVGMVIGVAGDMAIRAQQAKPLPGYVIAEVDVHDPATFQQYGAQVPGTLAPFNAHYVIRGGKTLSLEGDPAPQRFVVIAFDSVEKAKAWEDSPAYEAIKPIRHKSAKSRVFIAEGVGPQ
jgi:uncharacterized protein (DUF1330 family)